MTTAACCSSVLPATKRIDGRSRLVDRLIIGCVLLAAIDVEVTQCADFNA
jgi:hypothetical protein